MITVLNTVGTSVITNYLKDREQDMHLYKNLEEKNYDDYLMYENEFEVLRSSILDWAYTEDPEKVCAEIKSIVKIKEKFKDDLNIKLIPTDTLLSVLSAEIVKEYFNRMKEEQNTGDIVVFNDSYIIKKSDVHNNMYFKEGIQNLISILQNEGAYQGSIINFSGGYKSFIPYLTLYAAINKVTLCYIYEDSSELIIIPALPLDVDTRGIKKLEEHFKQIEEKSFIDYPKGLYQSEEYVQEAFNICTEKELTEEKKVQYTLSTIGFMLWKIYKEYKEAELVEDSTPPHEKDIKLRDDWGKDKLQAFSERLVNSPYVKGIINSLPYNPWDKEFIREVYDDGRIELVLTKEDKGLGLVLQSTGRNRRETKEIARILYEKYYK